MHLMSDLCFKLLIFFCLVDVDIVVDNCAICRNHIMDLCEFDLSCSFLILLFLFDLSCFGLIVSVLLLYNVFWLFVV